MAKDTKKSIEAQFREMLMSDEDTISVDEARKEIEKEWPRGE